MQLRYVMLFLTGISSTEEADPSSGKGGGKIYVCFKQRGLAENILVEEATVVRGGKLFGHQRRTGSF